MYSISNKYAGSSYLGYPLIQDTSKKDGINMVLSLMNQMSTLEKYDFLKDAKIESKFMDRLDKQVENDEYVKNKLLSANLPKIRIY